MRSASTSSRARSSLGPTTARLRASSGSWSRSCSRPERSRASSPRRRSSSASTWAPSTSSSRSRAPSRSRAACSASAAQATSCTPCRRAGSFPKFRGDLLESAVVARAMRAGEIEETRIPRNPLDVLAQQIVAICADEEVSVDELHELARRAYPFAELSRAQLENVLDMLAGRYPSDEFAELRPRIVWDRTGGTIRGRTGARRLAVTNAGTIPDRGLFGVFLVDGGGRVGELDEEMVYEAREGQTFVLGASTWRIEDITRDQVLVSPAPGVPGIAPFWKGEGVGRPAELGEKIGRTLARARRTRGRRGDRAGRGRVRARRARGSEPRHVPARSGVRDRCRPVRPDDRRRALPRRDRRLARLHPLAVRRPRPRAVVDGAAGPGSATHSPSTCSRSGRTTGSRSTFPDADTPPPRRGPPARAGRDRGAPPRRARAVGAVRLAVPGERGACAPHPAPSTGAAHAALAAAAEGAEPAAGRAPLPAVPDRARDLSRGASRTSSTCLRCAGSCAGSRPASSPSPRSRPSRPRRSPRRSSSTTSRPTCTRTTRRPRSAARRRSRSTATCCASSWASRSCASCSTSARSSRSRRRSGPPPRNVDELHDLLRRAGPLLDGEYDRGFAETLLRERRAIRVRLGDVGAARRGRGRRARSRRVRRGSAGRRAEGLPRAGRAAACAPCSAATRRRTGRSRRPRSPSASGSTTRPSRPSSLRSSVDDELVRGELRPGGTEREWCDPDVLRRIRRATLAVLRREVEPAEQAAFGRFLPAWHGIGRRQGLREALVPLQGLALPATLWESDVLPRRVPSFRPAELDVLCASGEVVWVGAGLDRVAVYFRDDAPLLGPPPGEAPPEGDVAVAIRAALAERALFWADLVAATGLAAEDVLAGLWELVWAGEVTNDSWAPLRASRRYELPRPDRAGRRFARTRRDDRVADAGSLVARGGALRRDDRSARARRAPARAAGDRHAGRRSRRGDPRRLRRRLRGAQGARDARRLPARVLRRGARRRAVRACPGRSSGCASCGRTAARQRARGARPRRSGSRTAVRRGAAVAAALGRSRGTGRRRLGRAARRRGGALRRAWRPLARAAARAGPGVAQARARGARRARERGRREAPRGRALRRRRRDGDRGRCSSSSRPASSPGRVAPCCGRNAGEAAPRRVPGGVAVRAPHLYPLLRGFVLGSFVVLGRELEEGAELPFAFEEHVERRGPSLYELRPLVRAFIEEREPMLRAREDARLAVEELAPRAGGCDLRPRPRGHAGQRGRSALPHGPPRPPDLDRRGVRRLRLGRRGVRDGVRRARAIALRRAPAVRARSRRSSASRSRSPSISRRASSCGRSSPASSRRTGPSRGDCSRVTSGASPIARSSSSSATSSTPAKTPPDAAGEIADAVSALRLDDDGGGRRRPRDVRDARRPAVRDPARASDRGDAATRRVVAPRLVPRARSRSTSSPRSATPTATRSSPMRSTAGSSRSSSPSRSAASSSARRSRRSSGETWPMRCCVLLADDARSREELYGELDRARRRRRGDGRRRRCRASRGRRRRSARATAIGSRTSSTASCSGSAGAPAPHAVAV